MIWRSPLSAIAIAIAIALMPASGAAQGVTREQAVRAAVHPVADTATLRRWLGRVPVTRDFPSDLADTLRGQSGLFVIEMTTAPGCIPCADLWSRLSQIRRRYGFQVRTINGQEAMLRSGRLGLPWVGHPVAWLRPVGDQARIVPIAIGTDLVPNLLRNLYLAAKMMTGVRPAVGVRAMSKFTGIVGMPARRLPTTTQRKN
jgi:hypothetical protein